MFRSMKDSMKWDLPISDQTFFAFSNTSTNNEMSTHLAELEHQQVIDLSEY